MWFLRRIHGKSMEPTYREGRIVLVSQTRNFKKGDVVVAFIDGHEVVKRIARIDTTHGLIDLTSDNPDGSSFTNVSDRHLEGKVIF